MRIDEMNWIYKMSGAPKCHIENQMERAAFQVNLNTGYKE